MSGNFLSIDWDYFIEVHRERSSSYRETQKDILARWYNEYFIDLEKGKRLEDEYTLGENFCPFLEKAVPQLNLAEGLPFVLTESHARAYDEVVRSGCDTLYLLDAHSDLGYGGVDALDYEVNCANWLGMLLKSGRLKRAFIIYSPYTREHPEEFEEIAKAYKVYFISQENFLAQKISWKALHLCRSGPWTPPWYDKDFYDLADRISEIYHLNKQDEVWGQRKWDPSKITLAEKINYKLGILR